MTSISPEESSDLESGLKPAPKPGKRSYCSSLLRLITFLFCCFLFTIQSMFLLRVYLTFPTTLSTNLTFAEIFDLPAVTICFKSDLKPSYTELADEVFKRNFNSNDKDKENEIKCNLMIPTINSLTGTTEVSPVPCNEIVPTVESINFGLGKKCYTFFSRLGKPVRNGRSLQVRLPRSGLMSPKNGDLMKLEIEFPRRQTDSSLIDENGASLSIHQGNELPLGYQKISQLKPGYEYMVTFNKIIEKRMPAPYRTGCDRYDRKSGPSGSGLSSTTTTVETRKDQPRSKYDCVDQCLLSLYRETCRCLPADINVRRDLILPTDTFCTNVKCQQLQIHRSEVCASLPKCKPNCLDEVYNFFTEVADSQGTSMVLNHYINAAQGRGRPFGQYGNIMARPMIPNSQFQSYGLQETGNYHGSLVDQTTDIVNILGTLSKALITVRKSSGPDVIYEHRPQYNYFDFIFQLMTLACVWLGVSVFAVFWKPLYLIVKIISICCCIIRTTNKPKSLISLG